MSKPKVTKRKIMKCVSMMKLRKPKWFVDSAKLRRRKRKDPRLKMRRRKKFDPRTKLRRNFLLSQKIYSSTSKAESGGRIIILFPIRL